MNFIIIRRWETFIIECKAEEHTKGVVNSDRIAFLPNLDQLGFLELKKLIQSKISGKILDLQEKL